VTNGQKEGPIGCDNRAVEAISKNTLERHHGELASQSQIILDLRVRRIVRTTMFASPQPAGAQK
jgi:hypothetical protein